MCVQSDIYMTKGIGPEGKSTRKRGNDDDKESKRLPASRNGHDGNTGDELELHPAIRKQGPAGRALL